MVNARGPKMYFWSVKYRDTEKACLNNLYSKTNHNTRYSIKNLFGIFNTKLTWKEFWNLWLEHKKKYGGPYCAYTGVQLNFKKSSKYSKYFGNRVSVDRLDPYQGYTKENIVFCCVSFNFRKGNIAGKDLIQVLRLYQERQLTSVDPDLIPQIVDVKQLLTNDCEAEY